MFVTETFLNGLVNIHGTHCISIGGGTWYPSQVYRFVKLKHHINSRSERRMIEGKIQYVKDQKRESFDNCFSYGLKNCKLNAGTEWAKSACGLS